MEVADRWDEMASAGWVKPVAQINHTFTAKRGTVRGMHFQRSPHAEMKLVSFHRLAQEILRAEMNEDTKRLWVERAVLALNEVFPSDSDYINWPIYERLITHAQSQANADQCGH